MTVLDLGRVVLHAGDCLNVLRSMPDESVDSIVTDPPYGLRFMGHRWDAEVPSAEVWREAARVLKPGAFVLSFSGTRTYHRAVVAMEDGGLEVRDLIAWVYGSGMPKSKACLKPALEPICLARKPGPVRPLSIESCRVEPTGESRSRAGQPSADRTYVDRGSTNFAFKPGTPGGHPDGRWPANLIHDGSDAVLEAFPEAPGQLAAARSDGAAQNNRVYGRMTYERNAPEPRGDSGSAARFFYCAKAPRAERAAGFHPTVKPLALMRYLVRLITPPGGTVLDPFAGSGSTLVAALEEGVRAVGCELNPEYVALAARRVADAMCSVQ